MPRPDGGLQNPRVTRAGSSAKTPSQIRLVRPKGQARLGLSLTLCTPQPPAYLFTHHRSFQPLAPVLPLLAHFADINTFMIEQIIKFTKDLPLFR